jgi:hypothetical protein
MARLPPADAESTDEHAAAGFPVRRVSLFTMKIAACVLVIAALALGALVTWRATRAAAPREEWPTARTQRRGALDPVHERRGATLTETPEDEIGAAAGEAVAASSALEPPPDLLVPLADFRVRGRVVDPDGQPIGALVIARHASGIDRSAVVEAGEGFDFAFDEAGVVKLSAKYSGGPPGLAGSAEVAVAAGARDVTLKLRRMAMVFGSVVDAETNEPRDAAISIDGGHAGNARHGEFRVPVRREGTHDVSARTSDGRWGVEPEVAVGAEQEVGPVRILVRPSATLAVRYRGAARMLDVVVRCGRAELASMGFSPQRGFACEVPACEIVVDLSDDGQTWQTRTITPKPGEQLELVFD